MSMPMSANLTTEPSFTPRKEFIRIPLSASHSFALLALSGANCIRLYSFPASVADALRHLFKQLSLVLSLREDLPQSLYEFVLDGKPWANAKSISTEKLLLDILAVFYQYGYDYLSTIDYGMEHDDCLSMVFSKPGTAPFLNPQITNPMPTNSTSLNVKVEVQFALSFVSATLMRVIAPPLHLTPAILQAVRAFWPRGVISEKKVGDNSFEFKLKGYKWFQRDTYATDCLRHILALLASLDSHSFSLLASLSLTKRSRVKDLWIFTGPAPERSLPVETPKLNTVSNIVRLPLQGSSTEANVPIDVPQPKQSLIEPMSTAQLPSSQHSRATTDRPQHPVIPSPQPHLLRKPAPRAKVPVSVFRDSDIPDEHHQNLRAHIPSTISTGVENMTGVGAVGLKQDVLSALSPQGTPPPKTGAHGRSDLWPKSDKAVTPPFLTSTPSKQPPQSPTKNEKPIPSTNDHSSPPLLGMNSLKDSVFSSNSTTRITLTGSYKKNTNPSHSPSERMPGERDASSAPIHENDSRIDAPAIITPDMSLKKSEAALIGMIASTSYAPSIPQSDKSRMKESGNSISNGGQGWVLVNVEGSNTVRPAFDAESACPNDGATSRSQGSKEPNLPLSTSDSASHTSKSFVPERPSPAAKAIVIMDAMNSKQKRRSTMLPKEGGEGSTGLKQFFSFNKKNSRVENSALKSLPRSTTEGTPEASTKREGK